MVDKIIKNAEKKEGVKMERNVGKRKEGRIGRSVEKETKKEMKERKEGRKGGSEKMSNGTELR